MPERRVKLHNNDAPWVTEDFKRLIKLRQRAFSSGNTQLFKMYCNKVNRERKLSRVKYYATKVGNLKKSKPKTWWSEIKRICGMEYGNYDLRSQLQIKNIDHLSLEELANLINRTFLEAINTYHPLSTDDLSSLYQHIATDSPCICT